MAKIDQRDNSYLAEIGRRDAECPRIERGFQPESTMNKRSILDTVSISSLSMGFCFKKAS